MYVCMWACMTTGAHVSGTAPVGERAAPVHLLQLLFRLPITTHNNITAIRQGRIAIKGAPGS